MDTKILLSSPVQMAAYRKHRRQAFWQILLPVLLASLVMLALAVFMMVTTGDPASQVDSHWANISLIWLSLPTIVTSLIVMALVGGFVYLMARLLSAMPGWIAVAQFYAARMAQIAQELSDKASKPVIKVKSARSGWQRFVTKVRQFRI